MTTEIIKFNETELVAIRNEESKILVAVNPIAEAIGLNPKSVARAINSHPILGAEATIQYLQLGENQKRNYLTIPIEYLNGWLFSIELGKVNTLARENLITYQRECYRALYEYFFGSKNIVIEKQTRRFELLQELKHVEKQMLFQVSQKKKIQRELKKIDAEVFLKLNLFPEEVKAIE